MDRLDKLPWATGLAFSAYGVHLGLRSNDATVLARLVPQLPPSWKPLSSTIVDDVYSILVGRKPGAESVDVHVLLRGTDEVLRTTRLSSLLDRVSSDVHHQIAQRAQDALFVHAGVVGWRGSAVLLPGRSRSGKSTMVRELIRAGAEYYSDEYAVFDADGHVHPYPKRLAMRVGEREGREYVSAEELGGHAGTRPLPVGLIVAIRFAPGAKLRLGPLSPAQAVLSLLDNTVLARSRPEVALQRFTRAVKGAIAATGIRGESWDAAPDLLTYLDAHRILSNPDAAAPETWGDSAGPYG